MSDIRLNAESKDFLRILLETYRSRHAKAINASTATYENGVNLNMHVDGVGSWYTVARNIDRADADLWIEACRQHLRNVSGGEDVRIVRTDSYEDYLSDHEGGH